MTTEQVEVVKRKPGRPPVKKWENANAQGARTAPNSVHAISLHDSRAQDARDFDPVHEMEDEPWVNPVSLPYIKPSPGMVQRWIRVAIRGEADPVNTARKMREGWKPRRADTVPENIPVPRIEIGKYAGCIGVEGSILCEMPVERNNARNKYFADKNQRQTEAIDARLEHESDARGSGFGPARVERSTQVVREVKVAADE